MTLGSFITPFGDVVALILMVDKWSKEIVDALLKRRRRYTTNLRGFRNQIDPRLYYCLRLNGSP